MVHFNTRLHVYSLLWCLLLGLPAGAEAQVWDTLGLTPGQPVAYDQSDSLRVLITDRNVYRSVDGGAAWSRMLSSTNAPFLRDSVAADLFLGSEGFTGFDLESTAAFGDVLFLTVNLLTDRIPRQRYRIYTSRDGGRTLRASFEDSRVGTEPKLGDRWIPSKVDDSTFVLVFNSDVPTSDSLGSHAFVSRDAAHTWRPLAGFRQNEVRFAGANADRFAFRAGDSLLLYDRERPSARPVALSLPGPHVSAVRFAERRLDVVAVDTLAEPELVQLWISEDNGLSFRKNGPSVPVPGVASGQILGDEVYLVQGTDPGARTASTLSLIAPDRIVPFEYDASGGYAPLRLTADSLLLNRYPNRGDNSALTAGDTLPAAFYTAPLAGWAGRSAVAQPSFDARVLPAVRRGRLRTIGGNVYATADGQSYTLAFRMTGDARRTRYFDGAVFNRSTALPVESYYLSYSPDGFNPGERTVVEARDSLLAYRAYEPGRGMYYSVDSGRTFGYLHDGYFWQGGEFAFGDPLTGSIYDFRVRDGDDRPDLTRVSRSDDQGRTWRLLDGAKFPPLRVRDYRYEPLDALIAYNDHLLVHDGSELYHSSDGGLTFDTARVPGPALAADIYRLGEYVYAANNDEAAYRVKVTDWLGERGGSRLPGVQADLSLAVVLNPAEPSPGDTFTITFAIQNLGTIDATGVSLRTSLPGFDEATLRPGFRPTGNFRGAVPAGEIRRVTTYWQRRNGLPVRPWGEIRSQVEPDRDSRPGNGSVGLSREDDEAGYDPNFNDLCVVDSIAPVLLGCPVDTVLYTRFDSTALEFALPQFLDECGDDIELVASVLPGRNIPLGTTTVTITASDPAGNVDVCTFDVAVEPAVGTTELRDRTPVRVHPNPVTSGSPISVVFDAERAGVYRFELFDALGGLVQWESHPYTANAIRHALSSPIGSSGTYALRIRHPDGRSQSVRLVVAQ